MGQGAGEAKQSEPKATVGRSVHYVPIAGKGAGDCLAAVVTAVKDGSVMLRVWLPKSTVVDPMGVLFRDGPEYSEEKTPGTWHWPERA